MGSSLELTIIFNSNNFVGAKKAQFYDKKKIFFCFCFCHRSLVSPWTPPALALTLVNTAAVKCTAASLAVREAADAAMPHEPRVLLLLGADTAVSALALLAPAVVVLTAARVVEAGSALIPLVFPLIELIVALIADLTATAAVEAECPPFTVVAGLELRSEVLLDCVLNEQERLVELIAVGRELITALTTQSLSSLRHVVLPCVAPTQIAARLLKPCGRHVVVRGEMSVSLLHQNIVPLEESRKMVQLFLSFFA